MAKKVTLVYFSSTKTTKKNLLAMAEGMNCPFETVDFTLPASRERDVCFGEDDFVIFGSPVYGGVMPLLVREYLEKHISGNNTPCAIVAVYGNRHFDDCLVEMEDLLTEKGFLVTVAAACLGEHSYTTQIATGRPDEADLAWAKEFGQKLQEKLTGPVQALEKGVIPGNRPYKERKPSAPMAPVNTNGCIHCGNCVRNCPVGAIDAKDPGKADPEKCIKCLSCVRLCPLGSKAFTAEGFQASVAWCLANFKEPRKEPVAFL